MQLSCSAGRAACTAATAFAGVAAQAIAELSTTEAYAYAARAMRVLCRGLLLCGATVFMHGFNAWMPLSCPAGRVLRAQLPPHSQAWRRRQLPS